MYHRVSLSCVRRKEFKEPRASIFFSKAFYGSKLRLSSSPPWFNCPYLLFRASSITQFLFLSSTSHKVGARHPTCILIPCLNLLRESARDNSILQSGGVKNAAQVRVDGETIGLGYLFLETK